VREMWKAGEEWSKWKGRRKTVYTTGGQVLGSRMRGQLTNILRVKCVNMFLCLLYPQTF